MASQREMERVQRLGDEMAEDMMKAATLTSGHSHSTALVHFWALASIVKFHLTSGAWEEFRDRKRALEFFDSWTAMMRRAIEGMDSDG